MRRRRAVRRPVRSLAGNVRVRVAMRLVRTYCKAQLLLREETESPPALAELIEHEFSGRTVAMIVEEYLDGPAKPRLRDNEVQVAWQGRQVDR